jgi:hypothetical protein
MRRMLGNSEIEADAVLYHGSMEQKIKIAVSKFEDTNVNPIKKNKLKLAKKFIWIPGFRRVKT